eukprot:Pgem_evm1s11032
MVNPQQQQQQQQQQEKSNLDLFCQELVIQASQGQLDPVLNRDNEIGRMIRILARRTKNNPVLIGPPGVGKTAIVEGLAQRIIRGDVTKNLTDCKIYSLDMGLLIAGASYQGQFEERLKGIMKELKNLTEAGEHVILFIDEIHLVLGCGKTQGAMDAANIMKPELSRAHSGLRVIGATTLEEYRQYMEKDAAFERRFQQVMVSEPSVSDTISILRGLKEKYEAHHGVRILDSALVIAAQLSDRYIQGRFQPDKSIDLVDEACAKIRCQLDSQPEEIDVLERRQMQLEVEKQALKSEKDSQSRARLGVIEEELANLQEELVPLKEKYEREKSRVSGVQNLQQKLDSLKMKLITAQNNRDLATVADLQYYAIPEVMEKLKQAEIQVENMEIDENEGQMLTEQVQPEVIYDIISNATGIPVQKLNRSEQLKVLNLQQNLNRRVVGQDGALKAISEAILRSRAGINRPEQPLFTGLFLGPTGVGKTEVAKALADELFDDDKHIIRIDMSEYMEKHSVARLIGAPPGYVGHESGGQLTEPIRRHPYNVVLFDEVEKAHPDVLNVLLQVLDDGRLSDGQGRTINFKNTIIILTSNVGAEYFSMPEVDSKTKEQLVQQAVRQHFKPELLNRLDDIVIFNSLGKTDLRRIASLQLKQIAKRLNDMDVELSPSNEALDYFLENGYDERYGARPMRRYLEKNVVTDLGKMIIMGQIPEHCIVNIDVKMGRLNFDVTMK